MNKEDDIIVYTVHDVARILQIGKTTAYQLVASEAFPTFRINRRYYITKDNFEKWMRYHTNKTYKF